jgi:hypothetical protein
VPMHDSYSAQTTAEEGRKRKFVASSASVAPRLVDAVAAACRRLAPTGWRDMLRRHGLDIDAGDIAAELARDLPSIDRTQPGFEDFAAEGARAIEPGSPSRSLLFHAFASPEVGRSGGAGVTHYPTPAEIEAVENYVFGVSPPSIEDLRARAEGAALAIVVLASEYRPAVDTVHRRHADMCFSRTGVARVGTRPVNYVAAARGFLPTLTGSPAAVAVLPCRYGAYIAALVPGAKRGHGPMGFIEPEPSPTAGETLRVEGAMPGAASPADLGDTARQFWIPIHKLFDGAECLAGRNIEVRLAAQHINEKIRRAHLFFAAAGHDSNWAEPDISEPPFVIVSDIAEFSTSADHGSWLLTPSVHPRLVEPAQYRGKPLTYAVPKTTDQVLWRPYESSLNLRPAADQGRRAPEYLHARHKIADGEEENLNNLKDVVRLVGDGGYHARHYVDYTGDGWIDVECPALALEIPRRLPAYSIVACPDFFPGVRQSELVTWTDQSAPPDLLETIWPTVPGRPEPLSNQRVAANIEFKAAGFDPLDDTMTAIVGPLGAGAGAQRPLRTMTRLRASMLPDGASGVFSPGWDVSFDRVAAAPGEAANVTFLTNYGLGSPFPEDSMLCAALSSFWPAVAPDITRTFAPNPRYATATPLTDDVIGIGVGEPWDGICGPVPGEEPDTLDYKALAYGDYVEATLEHRFNFSAFAPVTALEYVARTVTLAMVYQLLGVRTTAEKAMWALLSFRAAAPDDPELAEAEAESGRRFDRAHTYRFVMVLHNGARRPHPNPSKFDRVIVDVAERVLLYADPTMVIRRVTEKQWSAPYERRR